MEWRRDRPARNVLNCSENVGSDNSSPLICCPLCSEVGQVGKTRSVRKVGNCIRLLRHLIEKEKLKVFVVGGDGRYAQGALLMNARTRMAVVVLIVMGTAASNAEDCAGLAAVGGVSELVGSAGTCSAALNKFFWTEACPRRPRASMPT